MDHRAEGPTRSVAGPKNRQPPRLARWRLGVVLWALLLASFLFLGFRWNHLRYRESALAYLRARNAVLEFEPTENQANWLEPLVGKSALIRVRSIDLSMSGANDADLALIAAFDELASLNLRNGSISDENAGYFGRLRNLQTLDLSDTQLSDKTLAQLPSGSLKTVDFSRTALTDAGVERIAGWKQLTSLSLSSVAASDAALLKLAALPHLTELNLAGTQAGGETLRSLGKHPRLQVLVLNGCPITDEHLEFLAVSESLRSLSLEETEVGDVGISRLSTCTGLVKLILHSTRVTDRSLQALRPLLKLQQVEAENTEISPSALQQFRARHSKQRKPTPEANLGERSVYMPW